MDASGSYDQCGYKTNSILQLRRHLKLVHELDVNTEGYGLYKEKLNKFGLIKSKEDVDKATEVIAPREMVKLEEKAQTIDHNVNGSRIKTLSSILESFEESKPKTEEIYNIIITP